MNFKIRVLYSYPFLCVWRNFAKQVVFVGDIKQSIYGFQGADSWLVDKTREELLLHGATADVLSKNYRSRPSLVRWVNENYEAALNLEKNRHRVKSYAGRDEGPDGVDGLESAR